MKYLRSTSSSVILLKIIDLFDKIIDVIHIDENNDLISIIRILVMKFHSESIEVKDEESEFSRIVSISLNSSLKEIMIGDGCFNEFDKFELNSIILQHLYLV